VAATPNGNFHVVLARKAQRGYDVFISGAARECCWAFIDRSIPDLADIIVFRVSDCDHRTAKSRPQVVERALRQRLSHSYQSPCEWHGHGWAEGCQQQKME
jgi:hypothetical protein